MRCRANKLVTARDDKTRALYGRAQFVGDKQAMQQIEKSGQLAVLHEDGRSVLDWAKIGGSAEMIGLLKQAGAKE